MIDERVNSTTVGVIVYSHEQKRLELDSYPLDCGDRIELLIFGHWIPGTVQLGASGWYMLTLENNVGIRLQMGLTARCCKEMSLVTPRSKTSRGAS